LKGLEGCLRLLEELEEVDVRRFIEEAMNRGLAKPTVYRFLKQAREGRWPHVLYYRDEGGVERLRLLSLEEAKLRGHWEVVVEAARRGERWAVNELVELICDAAPNSLSRYRGALWCLVLKDFEEVSRLLLDEGVFEGLRGIFLRLGPERLEELRDKLAERLWGVWNPKALIMAPWGLISLEEAKDTPFHLELHINGGPIIDMLILLEGVDRVLDELIEELKKLEEGLGEEALRKVGGLDPYSYKFGREDVVRWYVRSSKPRLDERWDPRYRERLMKLELELRECRAGLDRPEVRARLIERRAELLNHRSALVRMLAMNAMPPRW